MDSITIPQAFLIGCAQTLALMPGVSRSGATMTAAMAMGITREDSARFSFLMMCPIVIGATALSLLDLRDLPAVAVREALPSMAVGCSVSLVCGIAVIAGLLKFLRTNSTLPFVIYRILFAASVIATHISRTS